LVGYRERDHFGDVGGDGQLRVELFGALFGSRVGDVVGEFGCHRTGFDDGGADVGLQLLPQGLRPRSSPLRRREAALLARAVRPATEEMWKAAAVHRAGPDRQPGPRGAAVGDRETQQRPPPAQVALAWLLAQHPWIVPIPGTTKPHRLRENTDAVDLELTPEDLEEITAAADRVDVQGERYPAHMQRWINR
jgi:hypothetical protein